MNSETGKFSSGARSVRIPNQLTPWRKTVIETFMTNINPSYILRPSPYHAVNTLRLGYKNQSVNVV